MNALAYSAIENPAAGYVHPGYARSLAAFGKPVELHRCGGWILKRHIPGFSDAYDAMGPYPLFSCRDWSYLHNDLEGLHGELVCLSMVLDPFGDYDEGYLRECFDVVMPFKEHYIVDYRTRSSDWGTRHHRYYARKSLKDLRVEVCREPLEHAGEWADLYANLIRRHALSGIKAFSSSALREQLEVPGLVMFRVLHEDEPVGAQLWYVQGDVAYSHLTAFSDEGYDLRASYAVYSRAIDYFCGRVLYLDLGAGAGVTAISSDGLSEFKRGWATGTRPAYFCGRIFRKDVYREICKSKGVSDNGYFPAYRKGEFGG